MSNELKKYADARAAAEACGADIFASLEAARAERSFATVAVSGGSTPRIMFEWMARQAFDWKGIEIFWVDERCVPVDDAQSNYRMTRESLLDHIRIDQRQVHRVPVEFVPEEAAREYAEDILKTMRIGKKELPVFDVLQRGMGPDMHTASLFPGEPLIENRNLVAAAVWVDKFAQHRVTLLPGVLEKARRTLCLVTGADKADGLQVVLNGECEPMRAPSQISSADMVWYVDEAASAKLS